MPKLNDTLNANAIDRMQRDLDTEMHAVYDAVCKISAVKYAIIRRDIDILQAVNDVLVEAPFYRPLTVERSLHNIFTNEYLSHMLAGAVKNIMSRFPRWHLSNSREGS